MDVPISVKYGIGGVGYADHIAETGTMAFSLDNSQANSNGTLGYYSPSGANVRSGFDLGIRTRLSITYSGSTFYKFYGTLEEATPEANRYGPRRTNCIVTDWMEEAAKHELKLIATQTNQTTGQLVSTIVGNMKRLPAASVIAAGQDTIKFAGDNWQDEKTTAYEALADVALSEWGYLYVKGDTSTGGVLTFDDRSTTTASAPLILFLTDEVLSNLEAERTRGNIVNRFAIQTHPRRIDLSPATCTLYQLDNSLFIGASQSASIAGRYTDPFAQATRVGGASMVTPVATTDYAATSQDEHIIVNAREPSSGTCVIKGVDITSEFSLSTSFGGNSVVYQVTNNSSAGGFLNKLIARGRGLYDYNPNEYLAESASSQNTYGLHAENIDLPTQDSDNVAKDIGDYLQSWYNTPRYTITRVEFYGTDTNISSGGIGTLTIGGTFVVGLPNTDVLVQALAVEPGSRIVVIETATTISRIYRVNGVEMEIQPANSPAGVGLIRFGYSLYPQDTTAYWVLGTSALDTGTKLGW
jgi:hypothetical protein